jgi:hypothetical protein
LCVSLISFFGVQKTFAGMTTAEYIAVTNEIESSFNGLDIKNSTSTEIQTLRKQYLDTVLGRVNKIFIAQEKSNTSPIEIKEMMLSDIVGYLKSESLAKKTANTKPNADSLIVVLPYSIKANELLELTSAKKAELSGQQSASQTAAESAEVIRNAQQSQQNSRSYLNNRPAPRVFDTSKKCTINPLGFSLIDCLDVLTAWVVKSIAMQIAGFLLWTSANMMNFAIKVGIVEFARWAPDTLYPIWLVVRQIISLFIVFAGLWLGFMYIINKEDKFQRYVPWIIMFALFVNFSYPLVRALTDVSNIVSLNIYTSALGTEALTNELTSGNSAGAIIVNRLGFVNLATKVVDFGKNNTTGYLDGLDNTPGAMLGVAFLLYATYVFAFATAIILMRSAILVFIIIGSPLLFVDSVIPKLGEQAVKVRKIFLEQLAVGPVFMILLAVTLKFLEVFQNGVKGIAGSGTIPTIFNISLMLVTLHIMLKITTNVAGTVGTILSDYVGQAGKFAAGGAVGLATGGTGLLARATIGKAATGIRDSEWMQKNQNTFLGRRAYDLSNSVSKSTFDLRNSAIAQRGFQKMGISGGMGAGAKGGYEDDIARRKQDRVDRLKNIGTHKKDVYDEQGKKIASKGDVIDTPEARKLREDYIKDSGGRAFGVNKDEMRRELAGSNRQATRDLEEKKNAEALKEYKSLKDPVDKEKFKGASNEVLKKMIEEYDAAAEDRKAQQQFRVDQVAATRKLADEMEAARLGNAGGVRSAPAAAAPIATTAPAPAKTVVNSTTQVNVSAAPGLRLETKTEAEARVASIQEKQESYI